MKSIRWSEADNPRDIKATWGDFSLRVRAEKHGTVWIVYIVGPDTNYQSEHISKDAAKQAASKWVRARAEAKP